MAKRRVKVIPSLVGQKRHFDLGLVRLAIKGSRPGRKVRRLRGDLSNPSAFTSATKSAVRKLMASRLALQKRLDSPLKDSRPAQTRKMVEDHWRLLGDVARVRRVENRHLQKDPKFSILNPHAFNEKLFSFIRSPLFSNRPYSYATIDLNRFKAINDTFGHETGDLVLAAFSEKLSGFALGLGKVGARGFASRFGGDEFRVFAAVPEEVLKRRLAAFIDRFSRSFSSPSSVRLRGDDARNWFAPTFSVGISGKKTVMQKGISRPDLIVDALAVDSDKASYEAKGLSRPDPQVHSSGMNSVVVFDSRKMAKKTVKGKK